MCTAAFIPVTSLLLLFSIVVVAHVFGLFVGKHFPINYRCVCGTNETTPPGVFTLGGFLFY